MLELGISCVAELLQVKFGFRRSLITDDRITSYQRRELPSNGFSWTAMPCTLPPEMLDIIIDHLHDEPTTLKVCCVVSKSWVPRTRKHIFARVEFDSNSRIDLWKKTFPDPSNSPAYHTRTLSVGCVQNAAVDAGTGSWIRAFRNVVDLRLSHPDRSSLVQFCGLWPTLRSLHLIYTYSKVFNFVCSFPLLEDLELAVIFSESDADGWNTPLTSPRLTGTLDLRTPRTTRSVVRRLLNLPGGLRFSRINAFFLGEDTKSVVDLVSRCSDTWKLFPSFVAPQVRFFQHL